MTNDTARRLAQETYPLDNHIAEIQRKAFLAGWDAAIEHAAQVTENHCPAPIATARERAHARDIAAAIRAERSDR